MKFNHWILLFLCAASFLACHLSPSKHLLYIDEDKPSVIPKLFAKDFITKDSVSEYGSVFNQIGNEFYFAIDSAGQSNIKFTAIRDGKWSNPQTIISDSIYSFNDPFLSPDETKLYYISNKPRNELDTLMDFDIWYSERHSEQWSAPIHGGMDINSDGDEYYMSFTSDGSIYFASNKESLKNRKRDFDIFRAEYKNGRFTQPQKLSTAINSTFYEADVFISPDESYIIFCSIRKSGFGIGDLYISFKNEDGTWMESINMGDKINTAGHELCPFVSKDGRYFFYTSQQDIYWVSTDIFENIKKQKKSR